MPIFLCIYTIHNHFPDFIWLLDESRSWCTPENLCVKWNGSANTPSPARPLRGALPQIEHHVAHHRDREGEFSIGAYSYFDRRAAYAVGAASGFEFQGGAEIP